MKRKAEEILNTFWHERLRDYEMDRGSTARSDAQKALCEDLLAALPEKVKNHARSYGDGWNDAITQIEQAIRSYFGQTKGKGE